MDFKTWLEGAGANEIVLGELPFDTVLPYLKPTVHFNNGRRFFENQPKNITIPFNGTELEVRYTKSLRAILKNGISCVKCGKKGVKFKILKAPEVYRAKPRIALFTADDIQLTVDHIVPRSRGGESSVISSNVQTMCEPCNADKGSSYAGIHPEDELNKNFDKLRKSPNWNYWK